MNSKWLVELVGIMISLLIVALVLLPIHNNIGDKYPFYLENGIFVFIFITFLRYIFLLKYHWFSHMLYPKVIFFFLSIPLLLYLVDNVYDFQSFVDEQGIYSMLEDFDVGTQRVLGKYIRTEMIFFWTGAVITTILFPIRMIISIWRMKNRGTV